ncbi:hypothetical protein [Denitromonas iodatirespirans]|uniref:Uncharacterized protein n=1 Tax=Denitromonas iodatirespirans TaxID=2795389 RepID=A0A944D8L4_DENI1|nr:hypothetical protein [Denitromonas iodatirespirans]MBT0960028.1 hypothetical protein [Denitromonas iodatirespirans]
MRWIGVRLQRIIDELFDYGGFCACCFDELAPPVAGDPPLPDGSALHPARA